MQSTLDLQRVSVHSVRLHIAEGFITCHSRPQMGAEGAWKYLRPIIANGDESIPPCWELLNTLTLMVNSTAILLWSSYA